MNNNNYSYKYFSDYLKSFNVYTTDEIKVDEDINEKNVIKQLTVISDFNKIASNYKGFEVKNFPNKTGTHVEEIKVLLKRYKRYIEILNKKEELSIVEEFILKDKDDMLLRAESAINNITFEDYLNVLKRSVEFSEVSIGNPSFDNISRIEGSIYVVSLREISFNFMEMDAFELLKKIKRRGINISYENVIEEFCDYNGLSYFSEKLIRSLLSFPNDYFKWCNNYRMNKKKFTEEEYLKKIIRAKTKDIKSLI
ncbi:MAG: hypothetical protein AB6733_01440 [Clostridiaceae bacterium]